MMEGYTDVCVYIWMDRWLGGYIDVCMDGWMDGCWINDGCWMVGWTMDEWMLDGWMLDQ